MMVIMERNPLATVRGCFSVMLVIVVCLVEAAGAVCPGNPDRSVGYVPIPVDAYDRNYSDITSEGKNPLGFYKAVWPYNQDNTPCISISGATSRFLEIMFETIPSMRLCVKVDNRQPECSDPGTGRHYVCMRATQDKVYVEFTCDSQCFENDVQFWYRLVLGVTNAEDPESQWCYNRHKEYPGDLLQLPADYPINSGVTKPNNATSKVSASLCLSIIFFLARRLVLFLL